MSARNHDATEQHGALAAEQPIPDPAPWQRGDVGRTDIQAVNRGRGAIIQPEAAVRDAVDEEQHEQRTHAIEAHALPQLGKKQRRQTGRMAGEQRPHADPCSGLLSSAAMLLRRMIAANTRPPS